MKSFRRSTVALTSAAVAVAVAVPAVAMSGPAVAAEPVRSASFEATAPERAIVVRPARLDLMEQGHVSRSLWRPAGRLSLHDIKDLVDDAEWLSEESPGVLRLSAPLVQAPGTDVVIEAPEVKRLLLESGRSESAFLYGSRAEVRFRGVNVVGWDAARQQPAGVSPARAWIHYRNGSNVVLDDSSFANLGRKGDGTAGVTLAQESAVRVTDTVFSQGYQGLTVEDPIALQLSGVTTSWSAGDGLSLAGVYGLHLDNVQSRGNKGNGIALRRSGSGNALVGVVAAANGAAGVLADGQRNLRILGAKTAGNGQGVVIESGETARVTDLRSSKDGTGVAVIGRSRDATVTGGVVEGAGVGVTTGTSVDGVRISNTAVTAAKSAAYDLGGEHVAVAESTAKDSAVGFRLDSAAENVTVDRAAASKVSTGLIAQRRVRGLHVQDLSVTGADTAAAIAGTDVVLDRTRIKNVKTGIRVYGQAYNVRISAASIVNPAVGVLATSSVSGLQVRNLRVQQLTGSGLSSSSAGLSVDGAVVRGSEVGMDLHAPARLDRVRLAGVDQGILVGRGVDGVEVAHSRVDAVRHGLRVAAGSNATVADSRLFGRPAMTGPVELQGANDVQRGPLPWYGLAAVVAAVSALTLEVLRRMRERNSESRVEVAPHVTNTR